MSIENAKRSLQRMREKGFDDPWICTVVALDASCSHIKLPITAYLFWHLAGSDPLLLNRKEFSPIVDGAIADMGESAWGIEIATSVWGKLTKEIYGKEVLPETAKVESYDVFEEKIEAASKEQRPILITTASNHVMGLSKIDDHWHLYGFAGGDWWEGDYSSLKIIFDRVLYTDPELDWANIYLFPALEKINRSKC